MRNKSHAVGAGYIPPLSIEVRLDVQGWHICRPYRKAAQPVVGAGFIPAHGTWGFVPGFRWAVALLLFVVASGAYAADRDRLLYHAETLKGRTLQSQGSPMLFWSHNINPVHLPVSGRPSAPLGM